MRYKAAEAGARADPSGTLVEALARDDPDEAVRWMAQGHQSLRPAGA